MTKSHRKTLIKKEKWPLIDGWYWCPIPLIDARIQEKKAHLTYINAANPIWMSFDWWKKHQYDLTRRLAHACNDGKIRAAIEVQYYTKKSGIVSLYGLCEKCNTPLSDGIKTIIILEKL